MDHLLSKEKVQGKNGRKTVQFEVSKLCDCRVLEEQSSRWIFDKRTSTKDITERSNEKLKISRVKNSRKETTVQKISRRKHSEKIKLKKN